MSATISSDVVSTTKDSSKAAGGDAQRHFLRLDYRVAAPAFEAMLAMEKYLHTTGLDKTLIELVKLRCSQINGCAFCISMHTKVLRGLGVSDERMHLLSTWHEGFGGFSEREQAALAWAESLTRLAETHAPDGDYQRLRQHFSDREIVDLTFVITAINAWNRLAVSMRSVPE